MAEKTKLKLWFANGEVFEGNYVELAEKFNEIISASEPTSRVIQLTKAKAI
jgi:hypothetical protein